jgi:hypothetical protein
MNLKEFDAKQFLLEKGERVGLGIALTLMVLMLIISLFMPSKGFFAGSPSKNAEVLEQGSKQLQQALNTAQPGPADLPGSTAGQLIRLDTEKLPAGKVYEDLVWFEPTRSDNPARRPPTIRNLVEAVVRVVAVPIDTYIFSQKFDRIMVLKDQSGGGKNSGNAGGKNALANMYKGMQPPGMGGGDAMKRQMGQFRNLNGQRILGADEKPDYDTTFVPLADVDPNSAHLARQLRPARMAIIAGSFPYKAQLDEFKSKLHLPSIQEVLNDTVKDGKDELPAFRFLGVLVQRQELDANGKVVSGWADMDLAGSYKLWMMNSGLPFEPENPKYEPIQPLFPGLVMPRLREFHEESQQDQMAMTPPAPGVRPQEPREAPRKEGESKYPDVAGELKGIKETLDKLTGGTTKRIAVPPSKFRTQNFDPFNPQAAPATDAEAPKPDKSDDKAEAPEDVTVPDYCLVRLVDVTIETGKFYRYRIKIRMGNPNYNRPDVASPAYKLAKEMESKEWFELPQTVSVAEELFYYVVDQKHVKKDEGPKGGEKPLKGTPMYEMWKYGHEPRADQVVFQFQRWVESTPVVPDSEPVPIGEWAVADRVFVARGEYIGQKVRVDLPVWKYTQDSFVLPAEDQKKRGQRRPPTGVVVDFGADNPDRETILVDFEGGKRTFELPAPTPEAKPIRVDDISSVEVVMLSPEGKLLARNSAADANDENRQKRRTEYLARIKEIREGKAGGAGGAGGLDKR